ncbi:efflux transporter periplasmic adaptor subunit [candidate division BRC1 bacterium HGW-BRC1-1]|nr:MAG: efflux transporter periplasmic adaptor subunit [candidate division BRC1 bacterium HGW-BRC1-1]
MTFKLSPAPARRWRSLCAASSIPLVLFLAGCGGNKNQGPPPQQTPQVAVLTVQPESVTVTTELPGRTTANLVAEIRPQVSGIIKERLFTEGANVKAGEVLYKIDPATFQATYDAAASKLEVSKKSADRARAGLTAVQAMLAQEQATLDLAQANRNRYESLAQSGSVSVSERDKAITEAKVADATLRSIQAQVTSNEQAIAEAEANIQQAKSSLEIAKINLDYTSITAPIDGRTGRSEVTVGALVSANQPIPLTTIQKLNPIYVDVPQSTVDLLRLRRSLEEGNLVQNGVHRNNVKLILEDGSTYKEQGTVQFLDVSVDTQTGSVILRMEFPNPEGILLPGMFVRAVLEEGVAENAIVIPQQAVTRNQKGLPEAYVVDSEGKAQIKALEIEKAIGNKWLVSSGLVAGDRIIVEGLQRVRPNATVKTVPFDATTTSSAQATETTSTTNQ